MFDDEKIKLIESMPNADAILIVWIKLLIQAGRTNADGYIYLNEHMPYTDEMLSSLFSRPVASIKRRYCFHLTGWESIEYGTSVVMRIPTSLSKQKPWLLSACQFVPIAHWVEGSCSETVGREALESRTGVLGAGR
jgi:hypothetical protein